MIRKILFLVLILGLVFPLVSFCQELKMGYVDIFKIFNEYEKTKKYDSVLEERRGIKEKELELKKDEIKKMQDRMEILKDEEQKKEREKIVKIVGEYREKERQFVIDLKRDRDEKMREIIEDINKVIDDYAAKKNFDLIFNKGAILYGKKGMDLTEIILKKVDQKHKK